MTRGRWVRRFGGAGAAGVMMALSACTSHAPRAPGAPVYPALPRLEVPADLKAAPEAGQRTQAAWQLLEARDFRGATRGFTDVLKRWPAFYPAEAGLGYVALAQRQFRPAAAHFTTALARNNRYLPALDGQVEAALGVGDDEVTIAALEQLLKVAPAREDARNRLDLVRLRTIQSQVSASARARAAGRLDQAQQILERALDTSPASAVILRELAAVETARGSLDAAENHVRRAILLDSGDAEALAVLGGVLEAQGKPRDAAAAFGRAVAIDPRPAWREKRDALTERANLEALPADYRAIADAAAVTRGQVAAKIGIDLKTLVETAPQKVTPVITDVRTHWAAPWILPVTRAGVMDVFLNHTFQPNAAVRRSDLAQIVARLLTLVASDRPREGAAWRAARPRFADVPAGHISYNAIAEAVTAGAMALDDGDRFGPARPASGGDLVTAIARVQQLARR